MCVWHVSGDGLHSSCQAPIVHPSHPLTAPPCAALAAGPLEVAPNLMQQLGSVLAVEPGPGGPLCGVFAPQLCTSVNA